MTKQKFVSILQEYNVSPATIEEAWITRPSDDIDEEGLREAVVQTILELNTKIKGV